MSDSDKEFQLNVADALLRSSSDAVFEKSLYQFSKWAFQADSPQDVRHMIDYFYDTADKGIGENPSQDDVIREYRAAKALYTMSSSLQQKTPEQQDYYKESMDFSSYILGNALCKQDENPELYQFAHRTLHKPDKKHL